MLTWNNNSRNYEATVDGQFVEVDGDVFAEAEQEMVATCGMSEQEAFGTLSNANQWIGNLPMDGVYIDGVEQR